ncbi:MAG: peptidase U34 [Acidobacteria bacterium]|nr:peptidase U34 [Acidobacteriota bacterium]
MCDTFVARGEAAAGGVTIFGKNSDREPNEAQALEFHPRRRGEEGEELRLTYLAIPQVRETRAVLISRPFWMWGAEIGVNEDGLAIGNEAVWTKMPLSLKPGLLGMDMLRLALERASTAGQALELIAGLLHDYGQGGICGFRDRKMTYHNSFIIADPGEAWVLETAGPLWAARKVERAASISNGLTLGEEIDRMHPELIATARAKGWLKKGETFHFSRCYSDWFYTKFSACRRRRARSLALVEGRRGSMDAAAAMAVLRDHDGDDYRPDSHFLGNRVCAHAANGLTRKATQTTAALAACLAREPERRAVWATGTAAPCTSLFKPVWLGDGMLPDLGPGLSGMFDAGTLWWRHERFHRTVLRDFSRRLAVFRGERDAWEKEILEGAGRLPAAAGERAVFTERAFAEAERKTAEWLERIENLPVKIKPGPIYRSFWSKRNKEARFEYK